MPTRFVRLPRGRSRALPRSSGIALITVLFLTILMSILALTMMVSVNSDMFINGYYGNTRAAYYAADSGMNVARQNLVNELKLSVNMHPCLGWGANASDSACIPAPLDQVAAPSTALSYLLSTYSSLSGGQVNSGNASASWPSSFLIANTANCTNSFAAAAGSPTISNTVVNGVSLNTQYTFTFNYTLCATGTATANANTALQHSAIREMGTIMLSVKSVDVPPATFAGYGAFIDNYSPCSAPLIPGIFSGPAFTNGAWQVSNSGQFIFTDHVGQANPYIDYWVNGHCNQSASPSYSGVNVTWEQGVSVGQNAVPLPTNTFSQKWAIVDGYGCGETGGPTCSGSSSGSAPNLATYLKDINGNAYNATATSGVYFPWTPGTNTYGNTVADGSGTTGYGGGFYVEGNASILLTPGTDGSGNPTQIYTITQGATITTITTDIAANTTKIVQGGTTKTLAGIPTNLVTVPGSTTPATMIYVDGTVTGLSGPSETAPAIQYNTMVTVAAAHDIDITGNILYTVEPVTVNTADTIIYPNYNASAVNVFGAFTSAGNIVLSSSYSDKNLEVDGSLAAIGASTSNGGQCTSSTCGFTVNGSINTFTNVGGQSQTNIFGANMNTQNTYYDRRFTAWGSGFAPPWFPGISNSGTYTPATPSVSPTQQRTSWAWIAQQ
jgi:Tfp pilus assembly protein PilX